MAGIGAICSMKRFGAAVLRWLLPRGRRAECCFDGRRSTACFFLLWQAMPRWAGLSTGSEILAASFLRLRSVAGWLAG
jgi:hypothetical protein